MMILVAPRVPQASIFLSPDGTYPEKLLLTGTNCGTPSMSRTSKFERSPGAICTASPARSSGSSQPLATVSTPPLQLFAETVRHANFRFDAEIHDRGPSEAAAHGAEADRLYAAGCRAVLDAQAACQSQRAQEKEHRPDCAARHIRTNAGCGDPPIHCTSNCAVSD